MTKKILVLDVGLGNVGSICNMFNYIGFDAYASSSINDILEAEKIILPGVGAFDAGMDALHKAKAVDALKSVAEKSEAYILGICLGMHLLFDSSEEGKANGLGLIPGRIKRFVPNDSKIKVPHMGWNTVSIERPSTLLNSEEEELRYYFVHSYYVVSDDINHVTGLTHHGHNFASVAEKGKIMGVQFHPEKSHRFGMALLKRFAEL
ncbi:MAG: imidazole glycerol phosphate synthase subunit HisH [Methylococcaceae bacterium]|nr:imidazole glycerol phosphate synthase subunit HisH [Methylococcaceae bacterium]